MGKHVHLHVQFPLVLVVWYGEASPVQDKQSHTNEILTKDQKDLKKMMTDKAGLNLTSKELADPDFLEEKSVFEPTPRDKSCKLFFWKTFSSC
uniref:Somatostatin/Cortistatin C-terminal domain-containing protein n=1 Tax=Cyprinus carpio TaxID=7962 RepID=A0A8C1XGX5_CYPCA